MYIHKTYIYIHKTPSHVRPIASKIGGGGRRHRNSVGNPYFYKSNEMKLQKVIPIINFQDLGGYLSPCPMPSYGAACVLQKISALDS